MTAKTTLEDVCIAIVDCEHKTAPIDPGGDHFAVGTPAMRNGIIDYAQARRISRETFDLWTRRLTPKFGDLLLAREAPVGPIVQIPRDISVAPGQRTVLLRANPKLVHPEYLFYLLRSPKQQNRLQVKASGSIVAHLNVADVRNFTLPSIPTLETQAAVANLLSSIDRKIEINTSLSQTCEKLLIAKFQHLGLDQGDFKDGVALTEYFDLNPPYPMPAEINAAYLDMQRLPSQSMLVSEHTTRPSKGGTRFQNNDTLIARITPCLQNRKTGFVDFLKDGQIGVGSTEYIVLRAKPGIPAELSYFLAISPNFRKFAIRHMVGTSGRQRLAASDLAQYILSPIPLADLRAWGEMASPVVCRMAAARNESRRLAELRDALLPGLLSGNLRIADAE
jgi:type I restriction enzyme, S subunit